MKMSIWRHVRLAGALVNITAILVRNLPLLCVGLCLIAVGIVGAIDRLEQMMEEKNNSSH